MGYWKWLYKGLKMIKGLDVSKGTIVGIVGWSLTIGIAMFAGMVLHNIGLVVVVAICGVFFTGTYAFYLENAIK